ncbi:hypothetical protein [Methylobacterium nonmethylotrophicum]|uniref:Uncharacterized protein n=1 Tax=Methylobacterium nonmethylotrophicum TaxID=1141884 RepID=A0A4Z0NKN6_9HYPH|nr:hypothetical protein [Methylobacterium nonmethylotrophicum]TGD96061.1 hypothetical protein EU555_25205 [Methylobacterium nonmethylotrophicum]
MRPLLIPAAVLAATLLAPLAASAQPGPYRYGPRDIDATGTVGGRAPWSAPWVYDTGGDNDRRPELPAYQQGGGQQTGGPARNLLPDDGLHIVPR